MTLSFVSPILSLVFLTWMVSTALGLPLLELPFAAQGRHVISHKDIATAEVVLTSEPYTVIANEVSISNVCADCFTFKGNDVDHDSHCDVCNEAWYCNDDCKKNHFDTLHHLECPFMKKVKEVSLTNKFAKAKLRSLIRLLVKRDLERKALEANGASAETPAAEPGSLAAETGQTGPKFVDVESLIAHDEDGETDPEDLEILAALKVVIDHKYIGESTDVYLLKLMSRSECNQFGLWSPDDDLLGLSLHPSASFFNHSCIPNCYSEWSGIRLVFKALYPIPAGSELTISYIDAHASTRKRKDELKNAYYFGCICPRCVKSTNRFPREYYDSFYQRYLRCPRGPGLMRYDGYQGEEDVDDGDANTTTNETSDEESGSDTDAKKAAAAAAAAKKKKRSKKKRSHTVDGVALPKRIPAGYEVRSCMTCSIQRCSPVVPSIQDYLALYNIYEPVKYMEEPIDL